MEGVSAKRKKRSYLLFLSLTVIGIFSANAREARVEFAGAFADRDHGGEQIYREERKDREGIGIKCDALRFQTGRGRFFLQVDVERWTLDVS